LCHRGEDADHPPFIAVKNGEPGAVTSLLVLRGEP